MVSRAPAERTPMPTSGLGCSRSSLFAQSTFRRVAMIRTEEIAYRDGDTLCKAFFAFDDSRPGPLPTVLISHMAGGRESFVESKAQALAQLGFAAFALDMYGENRRAQSIEEGRGLMRPFIEDRALLRRRILAALSAARGLPPVAADRIAAL